MIKSDQNQSVTQSKLKSGIVTPHSVWFDYDTSPFSQTNTAETASDRILYRLPSKNFFKGGGGGGGGGGDKQNSQDLHVGRQAYM